MTTRRFVLRTSFVLAFAVVVIFGWAKAQAIQDWFKLRDYSPPPNVSALAAQDTMTAKAKHLFYINHPELVSSVTTFRQDCSETEQTIVLGCYHSGENGIAVYGVQDGRLAGIQQVTAAHEMLHGAYERLNASDRQKVNSWLEDYFNNDLRDQRLIDTINAYKKSEPNDIVNEMHSIFGTEVPNLPANLETYYQRYFNNRSTVVSFAQSYESEFTSRIDAINAGEARLASLKARITSEEQDLNYKLDQINADRSQLDSLRNSGQIDQYNARVAPFNSEVDAYNYELSLLKADIDSYNALISAHNDIVEQLRSLNQAIDTRLVPQTAK